MGHCTIWRVVSRELRMFSDDVDMSPWSRMRTLQAADDAGIELDPSQFEELMVQ